MRTTDLPASESVFVSEALRRIEVDEEQRWEREYELPEDEIPPEAPVSERYATLLEELGGGPLPVAQLLGHPSPCQDDPLLEHVRALRDPPPSVPLDEDVLGELRTEARRWRLLAQAPANPPLGYDILGGGWIYFLVPTEDLAARRFDRVVARCQR